MKIKKRQSAETDTVKKARETRATNVKTMIKLTQTLGGHESSPFKFYVFEINRKTIISRPPWHTGTDGKKCILDGRPFDNPNDKGRRSFSECGRRRFKNIVFKWRAERG